MVAGSKKAPFKPELGDVKVKVLTNYFRVRKDKFTIMQWSIDYKSDMHDLYEQTGRKRYLLCQHKDKFPEFVFTGNCMFTISRIEVKTVLYLFSPQNRLLLYKISKT